MNQLTATQYKRTFDHYKACQKVPYDINSAKRYLEQYHNPSTYTTKRSALAHSFKQEGFSELALRVQGLVFCGEKTKIFSRGARPVPFAQIKDVLQRLSNGHLYKDKRDFLMILMMATLGLRRMEVGNINFGQINLVKRSLTISQVKRKKEQEICLPYFVFKELSAFIDADFHPQSPAINVPLFQACDRCCYGHRLSGNAVNAVIKKHFGKQASPHSLRKSFVTYTLMNNPESLHAISGIAGHLSTSSTMIYYRGSENTGKTMDELLGFWNCY